MNKTTRKISFAALLTALTIIFLYASALFPSGQLGFIAAASLFTAAAIIETGISGGLIVFLGSSILAELLLPNKGLLLLYILFFGYYPIVKSLVEKLGSMLLEWVLKLVIFNIALSVVCFVLSNIIFGVSIPDMKAVLVFLDIIFNVSAPKWNTIILYIAGNMVFQVFDFGLSKLIWFYIERVSKKVRK